MATKKLSEFASLFDSLPDLRAVGGQSKAHQIKEELLARPITKKETAKAKETVSVPTPTPKHSLGVTPNGANGKFPAWMTRKGVAASPTPDPLIDKADEIEVDAAEIPPVADWRPDPAKAQVPIDLYPPSRCTETLPDDLTLDFLVAEEKLDGGRYVLYTDSDPYGRARGGHTILSRKPSDIDGLLVDKTDRVPHISGVDYPGLEGTVLDGEMMREGATCLGDTSGILNANADEAVRRQQADGMIEFHVFDVICHKGKFVGSLPLAERRPLLEKIVKQMANPHIKVVEQRAATAHDLEAWFYDVVQQSGTGPHPGEGLVIKDKRLSYGCGWAKMKKAYDVSLIVSGFKPGKGKYANQFGSLALSVLHNGKLVEVAYASGMDDQMRTDMNNDRQHYLGQVVDVFTQELTAPSAPHPCGRLRHATFFRLRDDVNPDTVTFDKLVADLQDITKVRPVRAK